MNTHAKLCKLRDRYYAGRIGQSSFYRRAAALVLMSQKARVVHLH